MIRLAIRMLLRELRSGELRLLFATLCVAVAAVMAVGFLGDRVGKSLESEARQMLGADLVLHGDTALPEAFAEEAGKLGLNMARTAVFPSMVLAGERTQMVEIKAVSATYPLRGTLAVRDSRSGTERVSANGPLAGSLWGDAKLLAALAIEIGQPVQVGKLELPLAAELTREPDRSFNVFSMAPRLMMPIDNLPASGLIQFGARVRYSLLLAGSPEALARWRSWAEPQLERGQRLEDIENARPEVRAALDKAQRFLGLATLLTVILSAIGMAMATRRYMQRHLDACAVMRCLGSSQAQLLQLHGVVFLQLALLATVLGGALGWLAHFGLLAALSGLIAGSLPAPGFKPLIDGALVAAALLSGFAFPPLLQLARVPTLRVLRRELGPTTRLTSFGYGLGLLMLAGLIYRAAGDLRLALLAIAGFIGALAVFWMLARLGIMLAGRLRGPGGFGWRQGMATLARHDSSNTLKITALGIGLMALLLLGVTRLELVRTWESSLPADAPNRFVINIQPAQRAAIAQWLGEQGIVAELAPMVRARLIRINENPVSAERYPDDERAQRLVEREFNLSWRASLPGGNKILAGNWFPPATLAEQPNQASVEAGLAKTLSIKLGDTLAFSVAGVEKTVTVSSLRKLDWDSMRVNFFVLTPPGVLDDAPASYITSFHLPADRQVLSGQLVAAFPNLTVIDIDAVLGQIQSIVGQVVGAVQFVFLFTLLAGVLVLYAAFLSAIDERRYELAVQRALGARRAQLRRGLLVELACIGGLAGLIAAAGAAAVGQLLARQVFDLTPEFSWLTVLISALGGALLLTVGGWLGMRSLLSTSPMDALRLGA